MPVPFHMESILLPADPGAWLRTDPDETTSGYRALGPCSTLNVFVGPNNTGKSRLLRYLFETGGTPGFVPTSIDRQQMRRVLREEIRPVLERLRSTADGLLVPPSGRPGSGGPFNRLEGAIAGPSELAETFLLVGRLPRLIEDVRDVARELSSPDWLAPEQREAHRPILHECANALTMLAQRHAEEQSATPAEPPQFWRVYVPVLRGLRPLSGDADLYSARTQVDYFRQCAFGADPKDGQRRRVVPGEIFTGLELYRAVTNARDNAGFAGRKRLSAFTRFLSRAFFRDDPVELITPPPESEHSGRVLHVKVGHEKEQPIHHLGDGVAQILLMTMPLFSHGDKNLLLFIEEPELHLHAGFQRLLIQALLDEPCVGSRQVFITTHSPQFLDITLESDRVSVFHCRKELPADGGEERLPLTVVRPRANASLRVLQDLGITNSSLMLVNCTVWIEGVTDRMYLRRFLTLLQDNDAPAARMVEDLHFAFVEYGGSNITHWSFLDEEDGTLAARLCGELCLVADDDGVQAGAAVAAKRLRHDALRRALGERFLPLPCREIENLLTPETIRAVILDYEPACEGSVAPFRQEDYRHERLGPFIDTSVLGAGPANRRRFSSQGGTLAAKTNFAAKAIRHLNTWSDLSPDAQALTRSILKFVRERNPESGRGSR